jgi:hypothetical protein
MLVYGLIVNSLFYEEIRFFLLLSAQFTIFLNQNQILLLLIWFIWCRWVFGVWFFWFIIPLKQYFSKPRQETKTLFSKIKVDPKLKIVLFIENFKLLL